MTASEHWKPFTSYLHLLTMRGDENWKPFTSHLHSLPVTYTLRDPLPVTYTMSAEDDEPQAHGHVGQDLTAAQPPPPLLFLLPSLRGGAGRELDHALCPGVAV